MKKWVVLFLILAVALTTSVATAARPPRCEVILLADCHDGGWVYMDGPRTEGRPFHLTLKIDDQLVATWNVNCGAFYKVPGWPEPSYQTDDIHYFSVKPDCGREVGAYFGGPQCGCGDY